MKPKSIKTSGLEKKVALFAVMVIAVISSASTFKADFSGQWTFDPIKSNLNESGMMAPIKMIISQEKNNIVIQRISRNQQSETITLTDNISFDGKETDGTGFLNSTRRSSMTWESNDMFKIRIAIHGNVEGNAFAVAITETWTISPDRNALTIDRESNGTRGLMLTKHVYNREMTMSKR